MDFLAWIGAHYEWLPILLPLSGALVNGLFGRRLGRRAAGLLACATVGLAFVVAGTIYWGLALVSPELRVTSASNVLFSWITLGDFEIKASLLIDPLSSVMTLVVTGVGFLIHVYSIGYMAGDERYSRYFAFLNLFVASMLILVLADNFLVMYVGWELVGLCSYLLIGFWFERPAAADAGKKAFIVNRVGDFGFALGVLLVFSTFGSLEFAQVFPAVQTARFGGAPISAIAALLFLGAVGKSAQIPLHVWLPDAMEGPTPVSALIHAATMVTAGVYMIARTHPIYQAAPAVALLVIIIGAATAFFAATIALAQNDIKRVLAYSTISQLGYMFVGVGVGAYVSGIFHLATHAFFKALLFLAAGSVIHALSGEQDIRKMGDLGGKIKVTAWTFTIGAATLAGFPLTSGFFSKDEILAAAFAHSPLLWGVGLLTAFLTAIYAFRLVFIVFAGESRLEPQAAEQLHESPRVMTWPLVGLALLALAGGLINLPRILGGGAGLAAFMEPSFFPAGGGEALSHSRELTLMGVSAVVALLGLTLAYYLYVVNPQAPQALSRRFGFVYDLLLNKYYVDEIYMQFVVTPLRELALFLAAIVDQGGIDGAVNGIGELSLAAGRALRRLQTGYVRHYVLATFLGAIVLIAYFVLR
jgi:NADH-quinone oxidoreductase subunit L